MFHLFLNYPERKITHKCQGALGFGLGKATGSGGECYKSVSANMASSNRWLPSGPSIDRFPNFSKDAGNLFFKWGNSLVIINDVT